MRQLTKRSFQPTTTILSAGLITLSLSCAVFAGEAIVAFSAGELGATSYDPIRASKLNTANSLIYDRLIEQDADQSFHPHLATSWEESPDGMSWTFKLREGVTFHDGEVFNAETIKSWIPDFKDTENAFLTAAIASVVVVDPLTVEFVMDRPEPNLLYNLASTFMGVPGQNSYDELGEDYGVSAAVGTGPFKLTSFEIGLETVVTRNDDYAWASSLSTNQGAAHLEKITFREIPDQSTAFLELKTGGIDLLMGVPTDFLSILNEEKNVGVITMAGTGISYMPINTTSAPFDDINVRQATALAINQKSILESVYKGIGVEANHFLIDTLPAGNVQPELLVSFDQTKSNALLDKAGWAMGKDGVRMKDGAALHVKLFTTNESDFKRLTQVVQAQLKDVGMDAEITVFDASTIRDEYKKSNHQLAVRSYDWNNSDILEWFFSGTRLGYPNVSMWTDEKSELLKDTAMTKSTTSVERIANFTAYHEHLLSQHLFVPLYQPAQNIAFNKDNVTVPDMIRGPRFRSQTFVDIAVVN